jgi:3-oxoacyl-[acyl-carrier-protein] synthase III
MGKKIYSVITASGSFIPTNIVKNEDFIKQDFFEENGGKIERSGEEIVEKFKEITEIEERRYANKEHLASDLGTFAAEDALNSSGIDKESLDYIIVAHNFGDVDAQHKQVDILPTLASRVKMNLNISNPDTVAYDLPFGCPGWVQALIQADYYIKSGDAKRILVIAAETLSRVTDPYDRDSMIFSDGAGAVVLEAAESEEPVGILAHKTRTDAVGYAYLLKMGGSYNPEIANGERYIKMNGRKLYVYALNNVPPLVKATIEKAELGIEDISKVLIHQANAKMDDAMLARLFSLYEKKDIPKDIMPMTIAKFGNNSVSTVPILYDLIMKKEMNGHEMKSGQNIVMVSVGAGMNINTVIYKMP